MTPDELSQYLKISIAKVYQLVREKRIPSHNNHGFLRFYKEEVDNWMKTPEEKPMNTAGKAVVSEDIVFYRGKNVLGFTLTASKILIGTAAWDRFPKFIEDFLRRAKQAGGSLRREDVLEINNNANDYLRVSCQLGLIDKRKLEGRTKEYYPTEILKKFKRNNTDSNLPNIICDSILQVAKDKIESVPDERHSLYLLWYYLYLLNEGRSVNDSYFMTKEKDEYSYYPMIRHNFVKGLYSYLFNDDHHKAMEFHDQWKQIIQP